MDESDEMSANQNVKKLLFPMGLPPGIKQKVDVKSMNQEKYAGNTIASG
jgi:hypothetical protein